METKGNNIVIPELRRKFFYLCKKAGFGEDGRHNYISDYTEGRTASLTQVTYIELQGMVRQLEDATRNPQRRVVNHDYDRLRKGVLKAIGEYFRKSGIEASEEYIKATAIRATGMAQTGCIAHDFNRITPDALTRIYNEFCRKQKVQEVKTSIPKVCMN